MSYKIFTVILNKRVKLLEKNKILEEISSGLHRDMNFKQMTDSSTPGPLLGLIDSLDSFKSKLKLTLSTSHN